LRPFLIVCLLILTGFTFFAATQTIEAEAGNSMTQTAAGSLPDFDAERAAFEAQTEELLAKISSLEADVGQKADDLAASINAQEQLKTDQESAHLVAEAAEAELQKLTDQSIVLNDQNLALNEQNIALNDQTVALTNQVDTLSAEAANLAAQMAESQSANAALTLAVQSGQDQLQTLEAKLAAVTDENEALVAQIAALENAAAAMPADNNQQVAELETAIAARDAALETAENQIATLQEDAKSKEQVVAQVRDQASAFQKDLADMQAEFASLNFVLAQRDSQIEELRASIVIPEVLTVESCTEKTDVILANNKIEFALGGALIEEDSYPVLIDLAAAALACMNSNMTVTIAAHTDGQGGEGANQALSEERAAAVRDFLAVRGLPVQAITAVGFGETQPIADNSTTEGRALNRRITFDWQQQ